MPANPAGDRCKFCNQAIMGSYFRVNSVHGVRRLRRAGKTQDSQG